MSGFQPSRYLAYPSPSVFWHIRGIGKVDSTSAQGLIWWNAQTGQSAFWKLNTSGRVTATALPAARSPWQIVGTPFFDGANGRPEILWANGQTGKVAVWRVSGTTISPSIIADPDTNWVIQPAVGGD
jgi:hypothetical protein